MITQWERNKPENRLPQTQAEWDAYREKCRQEQEAKKPLSSDEIQERLRKQGG